MTVPNEQPGAGWSLRYDLVRERVKNALFSLSWQMLSAACGRAAEPDSAKAPAGGAAPEVLEFTPSTASQPRSADPAQAPRASKLGSAAETGRGWTTALASLSLNNRD